MSVSSKPRASEKFASLSERASEAERRVAAAQNQAKAEVERSANEVRADAKARAAKLRDTASAGQAHVSDSWNELQKSWGEHVAKMHEDLRSTKAVFDASQAEDRAEDAEGDAVAAINFAYGAIEEAESAVLDAISAWMEADELLKKRSTRRGMGGVGSRRKPRPRSRYRPATAWERSSRRRSPRRSAQAANAGVGPAPAELVDVGEHRRGRAQGRKVLEQQREVALLAEHLGREVLEAAVAVHEPRRGDLADAGDAGVAVRGVAHEREQVGDPRRIDAELLAHARRRCAPCCSGGRPGPRGRRDALREILVRRPDADLLDRHRPRRRCCAAAASASSASSSTIGHTETPISTSASSSGSNCARSAGSTPAPVL